MPYTPFDPGRRRLLNLAAATLILSVSRVSMAEETQMVAVRIWPSSTYTRRHPERRTEKHRWPGQQCRPVHQIGTGRTVQPGNRTPGTGTESPGQTTDLYPGPGFRL